VKLVGTVSVGGVGCWGFDGAVMEKKTEANHNEVLEAAEQAETKGSDAERPVPTAKQFIERLEALNPPPINTYTVEEDGDHYKISFHPRASSRQHAMRWLAAFGAVELPGEVFRLPKASWKNAEVAKTFLELLGLSQSTEQRR